MPTPHIESKKEDIAKTIIMPGDPLRAKYIADNYLENAKLINTVRNILAYTGFYKGKKITIFSSGMGNPSMGIYSYELYKFYDVENIIRIGTTGSYVKNINIMDLILVIDSYSESSYAREQNNTNFKIIEASKDLNTCILNTAKSNNFILKTGRVHCGDALYKENDNYQEIVNNYNCIAGEMETYALFHNARVLERNASCILTVSNSLITDIEITSEEREQGLDKMIILALESSLSL